MKKYVCAPYADTFMMKLPVFLRRGLRQAQDGRSYRTVGCARLCGATKAEFIEQTTGSKGMAKAAILHDTDNTEMRELTYAELGALCSNLSKGCEKQYRPEEAVLFSQLAQYYSAKATTIDAKHFDEIRRLIEQDFSSGYPEASAIAAGQGDRGALRALVWGEKVTRILSSLLNRYETQKDSILETTNIFVCEICGFVYVGDAPPEICPVCKVPSMKIRQIQRGIA